MGFHYIDWIIVIGFVIAYYWIGQIAKRRARSFEDYVLAEKKIPTVLTMASIGGTEIGLITIIYASQKGFAAGFSAFHISLVAFVMTLIVGLTGFIGYRLRQMNVSSIPEFVGKRFGRRSRILSGIILFLAGVFNMGVFLKVETQFLAQYTALGQNLSLTLMMIVVMAIVLAYTLNGGIRSIIVNDLVQFLVLSLALLLSVGFAIHHLGWDAIFTTVIQEKGRGGFDPFVSDEFGLEYVAWMALFALVVTSIWQTTLMRVMSTEKLGDVKKLYTYASVIFLSRLLLPYFLGICAFVFVTQNAIGDAVSATATALFLRNILPPVVTGIVAAGFIAAMMSTYDAYLISWATVLCHDIVEPFTHRKLSEASKINLTKITMCVIGAFLIYWGLFYKGSEHILDYLAITSSVYFSGAFAVVVLGLYWTRANSKGAVMAMLAGLFSVIGLTPVQHFLNIQWSSARIGLVTYATAFIIMIVTSLVTKKEQQVA